MNVLTSYAQVVDFERKGVGGGGYMFAPSIDPRNPNHVFLNCDMAGVYETKDGGHHWTLLPYQQLVSTTKAVMQFTNDPKILYTVKRSLTNLQSPIQRGVPAQSIDGGLTWNEINDPTETGIHRLFADPNNYNRLLVSEYNRLFLSIDQGKHWKEIWKPQDELCWIGGVFWDQDQIFVGTGKGLLVSHDGGLQFSLEHFVGANTNDGIFQMVGRKINNQIQFYLITATSNSLYPWEDIIELRHHITGIFTLDYNTKKWIDFSTTIPSSIKIQWVDMAINQKDTIYLAGHENDLPVVLKTTDQGKSWNNIFKAIDNQNIRTGYGGDGGPFSYLWGGAALGFDVCDYNSNIIISTEGYSHMSYNGGTSWRQVSIDSAYLNKEGTYSNTQQYFKSSGLDVTTGHQLFWVGKDSFFSCMTDIGNQFTQDSGNTYTFSRNVFYPWGTVAKNNWYRMVEDPMDHTIYAVATELNDMYLGYRLNDDDISGGSLVLKSNNYGITWDTLIEMNYPIVWLAMDPTNNSRLYISVVDYQNGGIYKTEDKGKTWKKLLAPPRTEGHPYNILVLKNGDLLVSYSARTLEDRVTLTTSSGIFYSRNQGQSWEDLTPAEMMFYTKDIIIDPHDPLENTWYASVWGRFTTFEGPNNAGNGGIYKTIDRGRTWNRIFQNEMAESMTIHPTKTNSMYVTVEFGGLYYSENINSEIPSFKRLESFYFPRPKRVFFDPYDKQKIWLTTMGGGIWCGREQEITNTKNIQPIHSCSSINVIQLDHTISLSWPKNYGISKINMFDIYGRNVNTQTFSSIVTSTEFQSDQYTHGLYFIQLQNTNNQSVCNQKIIIR